MAAGLITVSNRWVRRFHQFSELPFSINLCNFPLCMVHSSGGPLMDIVETAEGSRTGYLAVDAMDYANSIAAILYNSKEDNNAIREAAR